MRSWTLLLALMAAAPGARAQEATRTIPQAIVAVVDLARVSDETLVGRALAQELDALQAQLETDLNVRRTRVEADQAEFQAAVQAFQAGRPEMADAEAQVRETELREQQRSLEELIQAARVDADAAQRRLQGEVSRLTAQLDEDIRPHMNAVAESMGVHLVLPVSQTVFTKPELDITDLVITRVDAAFNEG